MTVYTFGYGTIFVEISLKRGEITQNLGNKNENGAHMKNMNKRFYTNQNNKGQLGVLKCKAVYFNYTWMFLN